MDRGDVKPCVRPGQKSSTAAGVEAEFCEGETATMPNERSSDARPVRSVFLPSSPVGTSGKAYSRRAGDSCSRTRATDLRPPLSARRRKWGARCGRMGIGRHDRVVVVLPNGPELAVAILTVRRARRAPR